MENLLSVIEVVNGDEGEIKFSNGYILSTNHESDCCEIHYWSLSDLTIEDFNGLLFDLSSDNFFERVEGYGVKLIPTNGFPISIPAYGYNNGYYSDNLSLVIMDSNYNTIKEFEISECQSNQYE